MTRRDRPGISSVTRDGEKLIASAATRNTDALCELLQRYAPSKGRALELASGTGQHVFSFARHLPGLHWQPSDIAPERRDSIDAYAEGMANISPAIRLDVTMPGWHETQKGQDVIILINLCHLITLPEVETLITEANFVLNPSGCLIVYGPFMRAGRLTSDGDRRFHQALIQQDPKIGYKDDLHMLRLMRNCALDPIHVEEMPANNLAFVARKPAI